MRLLNLRVLILSYQLWGGAVGENVFLYHNLLILLLNRCTLLPNESELEVNVEQLGGKYVFMSPEIMIMTSNISPGLCLARSGGVYNNASY